MRTKSKSCGASSDPTLPKNAHDPTPTVLMTVGKISLE